MAEDYAVWVVRVVDGDSIKVQVPGGGERSVRMYGIDAPETDQRGGREAHEYLRRMVRSRRDWRLRVVDVDHYQRLVGVLYPEGGSVRESANHRMVEAGWAYWYRQYGGGELGFGELEHLSAARRRGCLGASGRGASVGSSQVATRRTTAEARGSKGAVADAAWGQHI